MPVKFVERRMGILCIDVLDYARQRNGHGNTHASNRLMVHTWINVEAYPWIANRFAI